jgi:acyl-CoA synthetase (AMP-forming)/AMP-acid ligase II
VLACGRASGQWGQEVVAVVELVDGLVDGLEPDASVEASLRDACATDIARSKVPKAFVFVDAIQRSASGKPDFRWATATAEAAR